MAIFANLKYSRKEQANNLDVEKVRQRRIKGFTSINSTIAAHAFDFVVSLNINYSTSREDAADRTLRTHTSTSQSFGITKCNFNHIQMLVEAFICIFNPNQ